MFTVITSRGRKVIKCSDLYRLLKHLVYHYKHDCFVIAYGAMYEIVHGAIIHHKL